MLAQAEATEAPPKKDESAKNPNNSGGKPPKSTPAKDEKKESPKSEDPKARLLLSQCRDRLISYRTVKATIKQTVSISDQHRPFVARGTYSRGSDLKLRLELEVKLPEKNALSGSLLQVCDGQILWTRHLVGDKARITRRDVREILRAAKEAGNHPRNVLVVDLGLGGIPALLASIEKSMKFYSVKEVSSQNRTFSVIEGTWKDDLLKAFQGKSGRLPEHFPDTVRIYLDPKNLFPRRILYLKRHPTRNYSRKLVVLDFSNIVADDPKMSDEEFQFIPNDKEPQVDITSAYLRQLQGTVPPGSPNQPTPDGDAEPKP